MLTCQEVTERSSALIDGELGAWESLQMRLHLAMCKGCSHFIDQMRVTRDLTGVAQAEPANPAQADRIDGILSRLHDEKQQGD